MPRLKCLILDNDINTVQNIRQKLQSHFEDFDVLEQIRTLAISPDNIDKVKPDLIFLNIEMPDLDGFDLLNQVSNEDFEVIFTTAGNEFYIKIFNYSALTYLIKPIEEELFVKAVQASRSRQLTKLNARIFSNTPPPNATFNSVKKLAIPTMDGYVIKKIEEIIRIESQNRYAVLHFKDKTTYVSSYNIGKYKNMLTNCSFIQSHKSHIVNKDHIEAYHNSGYLVLSNGDQVPIASSKRKMVLNHIRNF